MRCTTTGSAPADVPGFALCLDEDSQAADLETALRRAGLVVARSDRSGMDGSKDAEQLAFAAANGFVIYTANVKDFQVLHRAAIHSGASHTGIILRTRQFSIGEQARRIIRIWEQVSAEEMINRAESLSQWGEDRR